MWELRKIESINVVIPVARNTAPMVADLWRPNEKGRSKLILENERVAAEFLFVISWFFACCFPNLLFTHGKQLWVNESLRLANSSAQQLLVFYLSQLFRDFHS
jgi:hypothetical protein